MNVIFYKEPDLDGVTYPVSAKIVSWLIAMFPMTVMVGYFLYEYCYNAGGFEVRETSIISLLVLGRKESWFCHHCDVVSIGSSSVDVVCMQKF